MLRIIISVEPLEGADVVYNVSPLFMVLFSTSRSFTIKLFKSSSVNIPPRALMSFTISLAIEPL